MNRARIPVEVTELTPGWLAAVLGAPVQAVDVLDAHSGTTGRARIRVRTGPPGVLPETLFVKLAPFDERQREFIRRAGIGAAEARLYATLGQELPLRTPRVWHAEVDDAGRYVMVLEDLVASGCTFPRPRDSDVAQRALATVEDLARLHAEYWESPRFATDLAWVPERAGFGSRDSHDPAVAAGAGAFVRKALERFRGEMPPAFDAVGALYSEHTAAVLDLWDEGERTLIHGDPHMGNLFADGARTGFLDWAMVSRSPALRDVAYFCCNSIPTDLRRAIEADLLARYREILADGGVVVDADEAFEQYRLFSVFSWVSTVSTAAVGSRWQPESRALAAMERTTAAIADLDAAGLLVERLGA